MLHPLTVFERHTNGMRFAALDAEDNKQGAQTYFALGSRST